MTQIKFRGLRTDGKGWAYGHYLSDNSHSMPHVIYDAGEIIEVKPETVGQFITDLYGETPVYDGDILQMTRDVGGVKPCYVIANDGIDWVLNFHGRPDGMNGQRWGRLSRMLDVDMIRDFGKLVVTGNIHTP